MLGVMRRPLGRLIGRTGRSFLSINHNYNNILETYCSSTSDVYSFSNSRSFNSFKSPPSLHFSRCTHLIRENPRNISHEAERGAKGGYCSDPLILSMETKKVKEVEALTSIKKGDAVNLSDLLFTKNRDYLIKCDGDERVKAEQLAGKVVVIYFDSVLDIDTKCLITLRHIYKDLQPNNDFEVVFVDTNDFDASLSGELSPVPRKEEPDEQFEHVFQTMPWTAIPLSDIKSRIHLKRRFFIPKIVYIGFSFVIDSRGTILQCNDDAHYIFSEYGAPAYPFSDERIDILKSEDDAAVRQSSLKTLLASPDRDYLISNKGDKVPIHTLEDKVVALFFYRECVSHQKFAIELKAAYEELAKNDKKFEVVLIYLYDTRHTYRRTSEESFSTTFNTMPWLALPFRDSNYKKLKRIFLFPYPWKFEEVEHGLIIIGPHMEFIQPFGYTALLWFKTPAYPFSYEKIASLETEEAKKLKLEMLWDPNSVFGKKYGSQVQLSELVGKRVIILFDWYGSCTAEQFMKFLETLKERYIQLKGKDDEFKVIHITLKSRNNEHVANLPWFVQPVDDYRYGDKFFKSYGKVLGCPALVAFDRDGRIVRKTIHPTYEDTDFPFYTGPLEKEALSQLISVCDWDWLRDSYPEQNIYTKHISLSGMYDSRWVELE